ncbi:MAG: SDR family NAD(P)-dependent oxidoreductase [Hespellia sp.]|nr:SDR family NAD(P)-dependent oxidoreductase [Hespellia sp.]
MISNLQRPIKNEFDIHTTAEEVIQGYDMNGKTVIITGGYSGIGLEITRVMTKAGATVVVPARTQTKAIENLKGFDQVEVEILDLMDSGSIDQFADEFLDSGRTLDILILCAGIMYTPLRRDSRGYESQFSTDYLGHYQLSARLWPALKKARDARVISVSSLAHRLGGIHFDDPNYLEHKYDKFDAYAQAKTANALFAIGLDERAKKYGVRSYAVHPGCVPTTDLTRDIPMEERVARPVIGQDGKPVADEQMIEFKTIPEGAATLVWCAVSKELKKIGGVYCENCNIAELVADDYPQRNGVRRWAVDTRNADQLWKLSEELTNIKFDM